MRSVIFASFIAAATLLRAEPVDEYVRSQLTARHIPGASLAVVKDGRIVKSAGYGVASLELSAPADENTVYEIGSISKQFAANAILLLVEDGKLRLDEPISKFLPPTPPSWTPITIRHVLAHTAGLADFDTGGIGFSYRREYTPEEFIELLGRQPPDFRPGDNWKYSNAFPLLGIVVERVAGMPYVDFVRARIFAPLGLASARFKTAGEVVPHRADGYLLKDGQYVRGEAARPAIIAANGGVMMNVVDFARWDIAITQGRLLRPESMKLMTEPVRLNDGRTVAHGLGWFLDTFNGHRFGAHWGTTVAGYSAVIRRYVDDNVTVIMLANVDEGGGLAVDAMSRRIADMYVPGTDIHGLQPKTDPAPAESERLRKQLGDKLPPAATLEFLGEEAVGAGHFNLNPAVVRVKRYRARTPEGLKYVTLRLSREERLLGVLIED
ncbi:MAG TPA: serine hydrolase domain-containing protein [Vicinamibacterales bacterium]|nr:serine hydrolase domain-containing protein [Vicinamibacterales bacterium]